jgi:hypothetical protein
MQWSGKCWKKLACGEESKSQNMCCSCVVVRIAAVCFNLLVRCWCMRGRI